jgi:hypothetical protein
MRIIFKSNDYAEAHIVAGMLENAGIHALVGGHYLQGALGEFGLMNTVDVRVEPQDFEQASNIVNNYEDPSEKNSKQNKTLSERNPIAYFLIAAGTFVLLVLLAVSL